MENSPESWVEGCRLLGGAGDAGEGFGVVEVEDAAFFVGGELTDFGAVGPDDGAGADVERGGLQFGKKFCGKDDRVAAAAFEDRENDWRMGGVKRGDEIADEIGADEWMVDEAEEHAIDAGGQTTKSRLNRGELAFFPVGVNDHFIGWQVDGFGDGFGVDAEDDAAGGDFRVAGDVEQMLEERAALVGKKGLWRAHALRGSAGEDDSGKHENSGSYLVSTGSGAATLTFL